MYTAEGALLSKVSSNEMAVYYPDTIQWSPDSQNIAFVARFRNVSPASLSSADQINKSVAPVANADVNDNTAAGDANLSANANTNADANVATPANSAGPVLPPAGILTFRTEQIYLANADGGGTKPLTQNEGLIYFYYVWSPDSTGACRNGGDVA